MKVKFTTGGGKTSMLDGKIISRTGGVLACVPTTTYGGSEVYSVTHTLTGTAIRSIFKTPREAEKFARGFYRQCNDFEKMTLRMQSNADSLRRSFDRSTATFVRNYRDA